MPIRRRNEKTGSIYILRGKKQIQVDKLTAGDIGAIAKLQNTVTGDTLCDPASPVMYEGIEFPEPSISMAVAAEKEGEEEKVFSAD
jgi:elongation factor G